MHAPPSPPQKKKLHNCCSQDFFWILQSQEDKRNVLHFWRKVGEVGGGGVGDKVHYGMRENGEF